MRLHSCCRSAVAPLCPGETDPEDAAAPENAVAPGTDPSTSS